MDLIRMLFVVPCLHVLVIGSFVRIPLNPPPLRMGMFHIYITSTLNNSREQSTMLCALRLVSLPVARARAPSSAPSVANA